jgi:hypothetical protein
LPTSDWGRFMTLLTVATPLPIARMQNAFFKYVKKGVDKTGVTQRFIQYGCQPP